MNPENSDKKLDGIIQNAIGTEDVKLDFEKWKADHKAEIDAFQSQPTPSTDRFRIARLASSRYLKFAAAAALIVAAGIVMQSMQLDRTPEPAPKSPAAAISRLALTIAYTNGGLEAVEDQYEQAWSELGPRAGAIDAGSLANNL